MARQAFDVAMEANNASSGVNKVTEAVVRAPSEREEAAIIHWLRTEPTSLEGIAASLEHAARYDPDLDYDSCTNLLEGAHCDGKRREAPERYPAMIAAALRKIASR